MSSWLCFYCNSDENRCYEHNNSCGICCGCEVIPVELSISNIGYLYELVEKDYYNRTRPLPAKHKENLENLLKILDSALPEPL